MIEITEKEQLRSLAPLFNGIEDSMVIACLQGYMGNAYTVVLNDPKAALIVSGEYCFWGGDPDSGEAEYLVAHLFDVVPAGITIGIFADDKPQWETVLMNCSENNPKAVPRYGMVQKNYDFDPNRLQSLIDSLPEGFDLVPFSEDIYHQAMAEDWAKEFCETFDSAEDYLSRGFGYAALKDGRLVSGASTMTVCDGAMEIQVATHENFRRKGLALPCCAALIRESSLRKIQPYWDAATLTSKHMAMKLGYEYKGVYTTIHMHK